MKFITTYLQPGEEIKYRARIHIFLFLQPALLLLLSRRRVELVLVKCEDIQVVHGVLGRIIGYGSIVVFTGGTTNSYYYVGNSLRFKQAINMQIESFLM